MYFYFFPKVSSAILQVTIFSVASLFPPRYISAIITGLAIGGVFAAIAQIVSLWVGASATGSAFVYFIIADVFIALSFICFLITQRTVSDLFISNRQGHPNPIRAQGSLRGRG